MSSLVFRVAAGVVNGAACAVNHLLETMYPQDIGHIWEDVPAGSVGGPAPTDPPSGGVADPAAETVTPDLSAAGSPPHIIFDERCDCTHLLHPGNVCAACGCNYSRRAATPTALTWAGWAVPAILDVLAEHQFCAQDGEAPHRYTYHCQNPFEAGGRHHEFESRGYAGALEEWHEHIAPLIAERIGCDPTRAALALTSLQTQ